MDAAITDETHYMQRANGMLWRERSKRCFTPQFWECTSLALKPQSPPTNLNPEEATEQLANYWTPTNTAPTSMSDQQKTNNWEHMADAAGIAHLPQKPTPTREEARDEFAKRCRKAKGAPGIDGWTATLTKLTANHIPFISYEVADILYDAAFLNDTDDSTSTDADATLPHRRPSQPTCSSADGVANNPNDGPAHPQHHCDDATTSRQGPRTPNDQLIEFANQFYRLRVTCLRKTDEKVRGISVASILARNWHSTLLVLLTLTPSDPNQHGSCPKRSVITATASWLAATATAASGSELDLSAAFDTMAHGVATAALARQGTPRTVLLLFRASWQAPRLVLVGKVTANTEIHPTCSLPQGVPEAPTAAAEILRPSTTIAQNSTTTRAWGYVDDRSITCSDANANMDHICDQISARDATTGLSENTAKRQTWYRPRTSDDDHPKVEHLGLIIYPTDPTAHITPKKSWDAAEQLISRLAYIPHGIAHRLAAANSYVKPLFNWAAPFMDTHPNWHKLAIKLRQSIIHSKCSWWCPPRFWIPLITTHPRYAPVIAAFTQARKLTNDQSPHLHHVLHRHATHIGVTYHGFDNHGPIIAPGPDAHPHLRKLFREHRHSMPSKSPNVTDAITVSNSAADHLVRMAARYSIWTSINPERHDAEAYHLADLQASSHPLFTKWTKTLSPLEASRLRIFRGGASKTPTRTQHMTNTAKCPYCPAELCSIRHLATECPILADQRANILRTHHTTQHWLSNQPRISTKSGWITANAHSNGTRRADLQVCLCKLGIAVLALGDTTL